MPPPSIGSSLNRQQVKPTATITLPKIRSQFIAAGNETQPVQSLARDHSSAKRQFYQAKADKDDIRSYIDSQSNLSSVNYKVF